MANTTISPNMNLPVPNVGIDAGPDWANNLNASLAIVDQHNHTSGQGVQIPPAGLNINSNLTFQDNQATNLQASVYTAQTSLSTQQAVYVSGVDLYYNDGSGNKIRMTSGGSVNATSSGIASGNASASFVSSVLVVNEASNTPGNIQAGSILIGNNTAGSYFITLQPPSGLGSNYSLTLPAIPASTSFVTIDSSGNFGTAGGVSGSQIATGSLTGSQLANATVTTTQIAAVNYQESSSCGSFSTNSTTAVNVTNLSVTITTTGKPVEISLIPDPAVSYPYGSGILTTSSATAFILINNTTLGTQLARFALTQEINTLYIPPTKDIPAAGTYTYTVQAYVVGTDTVTINYFKLFAYEIK